MSAQTPSRISRCLRATTFPERTRLRQTTLHHSTFLYSTQTNAKHLNSAKTPPKPHKHTLYFLLFFRFFFLYLSIFISFFTFFYTSRVAGIFVYLFCFCERGSGGVWPAGVAWARQRGVWPANCVHGVCSGRAEAQHHAMWLQPLSCLQTTQWLCRLWPARKTAFCLLFLTAAGKLVCMVGCALFLIKCICMCVHITAGSGKNGQCRPFLYV